MLPVISFFMQWHTRTLLSIYWICAAFYQCFYNQTLNISHKSYCINGVLWNVPSCFLYESNLWHCAFVLMKNEYEKHISQRTRIPKKKQQHESTLHRGHRLCGVEIFHTQIGRCFQLTLLLKCDYLAFVYYVESTCLTFYTFCSGLIWWYGCFYCIA
jgi:hypothetical protein